MSAEETRHTVLLPSGTDLRDILTDYGDTKRQRVAGVAWVLSLVRPVPESWVEDARKAKEPQKTISLKPSHCDSWEELLDAWGRKTNSPMRWRQELSNVLATMLAVALSTEQTGDQLFLQVVAVPGMGKSVMADALTVSKHCFPLEHLVGFHSGYRDKTGEDFSLLARVNRKCMVTSEGDVLFKSPNLDEIMSEMRRIFDGKSSKIYKTTKVDKWYDGLRTPWIICGTPAMIPKGQADIGDRFLKIYIDTPGHKERKAIVASAILSALAAVKVTSNGTADSSLSPGVAKARCLTAGYLDYLLDGIDRRVGRVTYDDDQMIEVCGMLGEFVADYRARTDMDPRKESDEGKEIETRIAKQLARLAVCVAVVLQKDTVDDGVFRVIKKVAIDTARGRTLEIAGYLHSSGEPRSSKEVATHIHGIKDEEGARRWLTFMRRVGIVAPSSQEIVTLGGKTYSSTDIFPRWQLSPRAAKLYQGVMPDPTMTKRED
jgi:hypothetical protein